MKIFVAGATGAIGQPLLDCLIYDGHEVYGVYRREESARDIAGKDAKPVHLDVLDKEAVFKAIESIRPDVVIDMLTALPSEYTPEAMRKATEMDRRVRKEGGGNLQEAAEKYGVGRYIVQSCGFWYAPGAGLADESAPFAFDSTPAIASGCKLYAEIEQRVLLSEKLEGVALRFGFFYGPGTWYHSDGFMAEQIRQKRFPIIGHGEGVWNFVHIKDAARAAAEAVYSSPGVYNVVNDRPASLKEWLPAFARHLNAPYPPEISEEEGLNTMGAEAVYYATKLRGASNHKARQELHFKPRSFEWLII